MLLIGKNGSGKSTVAHALEILQKIARGTNQIADLAKPKDFAHGRSESPMRFQLEVELGGKLVAYSLALECPKGWKELRVFDESLHVDSIPVYQREAAKVTVEKSAGQPKASFFIDWHVVALPIVQQSHQDALSLFKQWLARLLILAPLPSLIGGDSQKETLTPTKDVTNFAAWFSGLIAHAPSSYAMIDAYLRPLLPDMTDIKNPEVGTESRSLTVQFANDRGSLTLPFAELSAGEKCFMICALVIAANQAYGPLLCFWDEPDNHLSLSEVGHFVLALRKSFKHGGQFIATSHNPETIRSFSDETTLVLSRMSHLEPTTIRPLSELKISGDLITALIAGDIES
jgi:energy-coupling factor transporter ATP-binding protein EcfA2